MFNVNLTRPPNAKITNEWCCTSPFLYMPSWHGNVKLHLYVSWSFVVVLRQANFLIIHYFVISFNVTLLSTRTKPNIKFHVRVTMCYVEWSICSKAVYMIVPRNCCWFQEARRSNLRTSVESECENAWRCKSCVSWGMNTAYNIKRYSGCFAITAVTWRQHCLTCLSR